MPILLLAIFIGLPLLEIAVFIEAGALIGLWPTIAAILATGAAGAVMLRIQGFGVIRRIREQSDEGHAPVVELFEGFCLLLAGVLLLTPGFVTDLVGFLLFLPFLRRRVALRMANRRAPDVHVFGLRSGPGRSSGGGAPPPPPPGAGPVIEGEFVNLGPDETETGR